MKKFRVELELIVEARDEDQAYAIATGAANKAWLEENVEESFVVIVTEMDDE